MKAIKSIIILLVAIPAMAVYALFEAINALAIEIDLVRIRTMMRCCRKFRRCNYKSLIFIYHKPRKYEEKESLL